MDTATKREYSSQPEELCNTSTFPTSHPLHVLRASPAFLFSNRLNPAVQVPNPESSAIPPANTQLEIQPSLKMKIPSGSATNPSPPNEPGGHDSHRITPAPKPSTSQPHHPPHLTRHPRRPSKQPLPSPPKSHIVTLTTPTKTRTNHTPPPKPSKPSPPEPYQSPPNPTTATLTSNDPTLLHSGRKRRHEIPSSTPLKKTIKGSAPPPPPPLTRVERVVAAEVARMALGGVWRVVGEGGRQREGGRGKENERKKGGKRSCMGVS